MEKNKDIKNKEFESQINIFKHKNMSKSEKMIVEGLERVQTLRQIRIQETKILEKKSKFWDGIWLFNSISLIILSIVTFFISKLPNNNYNFDILTLYITSLTIVILVMTYYVKSQNFEKQIVIKHHEQSTYRNLISDTVKRKTITKQTNTQVYDFFITQRNTITQFTENHSRLAYMITKKKHLSNDLPVYNDEDINKEYKHEFETSILFIYSLILFNFSFILIELIKNFLTNWNIISLIPFLIYVSNFSFNIYLIIKWNKKLVYKSKDKN